VLAMSPRRCGLLAVLIVVAIAALAPAAVAHGGGTAPGAPGAEAWWTPADKGGFGTAASLDSKLWHTLEQGELTEVYYPDLGTPSLRSLEFVVTDGTTDMVARYTGILPDLFREGQGVVIEGAVATDGSFAATNVLAKHDEKYMPKALVDELKAKGEWRPDEAGS